MSSFIKLKKELFYFRKAVFQYHAGWRYLYNKFFLAPKILQNKKIFHNQGPTSKSISIHLLTGRSDLVMCLWSLASFLSRSGIRGELYVHSDGSLRSDDSVIIKKFIPEARVVLEVEGLKRVNERFSAYPRILALRQNSNFVLLKKLLDPLAVSASSMRLVIDSDLAWFKKPQELEEILQLGLRHPVMMRNNGANYVRFTDGSKISEAQASLNSGIVAYRPEQFSLIRLEEYLNKIDFKDPQTRHFIEQAGYAWALESPESLSPELYTIKRPYSEELILRHYTSPRRPLFYLEALPRLARLLLKS